jgi:hypothetical protein
MIFCGRSLASARQIAIVLGAAGALPPYLAMRAVRVPRAAAVAATALAMALPWNAWLGAATVPDGWTGALLAAAAIAMTERAAWGWASGALFAASLSRYEAWPVCAAFALGCLFPHAGRVRGRDVAWATLAVTGPLFWMAWNAHAHGSAFHFVARVSNFRRAIGAADLSLRDKILGYPRAFFTEEPVAAALGALGLAGLLARRPLRLRWWRPLACAVAVMAFLIVGDLGDGAPTHHPARALASVFWIATGMGIDALYAPLRGDEPGAHRGASRGLTVLARAGAVAAGLSLVLWLPSRWVTAAPGTGESERRDAQIARGLELRAKGIASAEITPCQFEHFALLAAWGAPERAHVNPRTQRALTADCPALAVPVDR